MRERPTRKKHSHPLKSLLDKTIERYCVERFLWPTYWPNRPRRITASAIRRVRALVESERFGELFYRISLARKKIRMEEWGYLPPNPVGVQTSVGEKRFRRLWRKCGGDLKQMAALTANSTPSIKAYAGHLGL